MHRSNRWPRLATVLASFLLALLAPAGRAHAQLSSETVGGPVTTKRLERLLRVYVQPTVDEAGAIDRLHEAYLDRFRAEIDPETKELMKGFAGRPPSLPEFKKLMREIERLQTRIADADNALLAGATELVAEERRGGFQRIRDARERQRQLMGVTRFLPMMMGGGGSFVDLADLLARDEVQRAVPPEARERFDAFLRAQESRTLVQARSYNTAAGKAFEGFFERMLAAQAEMSARKEGETPEEALARARSSMERMRAISAEIGAEPRKVIAANFKANRAACAELATILPEDAVADLRIRLAERSMGAQNMMRVSSANPNMEGVDPATTAARIRRDPAVTDEQKSALAEIVRTWRRGMAAAQEALAEVAVESEPYGDVVLVNGEGSASKGRFEAAEERVGEVTQAAYRAMRGLLADRSERYFGDIRLDDKDMLQVLPEPPAIDDEVAMAEEGDDTNRRLRLAMGFMNLGSSLSLGSPAEFAAQLERLGVGQDGQTAALAVLADWTSGAYAAKVGPALKAQADAFAARVSVDGAGGVTIDRAQDAVIDRTTREALDAYFAAEAELLASLAAATGLAADGPEMTALRIDRITLAAGATAMAPMLGERSLALPLEALARARVDAVTARSVFSESIAEWRAYAAAIPERCREAVEEDARQRSLEAAMSSDDEQAREAATTGWMQFWSQSAERRRKVVVPLSALFRASVEKAVADPALRRQILAAERAQAFPDYHKPSDNASRQLAAALALDALTDDQRTRVEVLQAEYDAVFETLTEKMVELASQPKPTGPDAWRAEQLAREEIEKVRFQRTERTNKARGELRRILGDELARTVRGLVPKDDAVAGSRRNPNGFLGLDGDDDD